MKKHEKVNEILFDIQADELVQQMKDYIQHGNVTTYDHCESVAKMSYLIDKRLCLHSDLNVLIAGAMLHDFYLYDWHDGYKEHPHHGFTHAELASQNARNHLNIDSRTADVIYCHMWPLNLRRVPRSREAWIVCMADKIVALHETFFKRKKLAFAKRRVDS